ncbi:MAG: ATP-binding protein, partial [Candidatus Obscuribacterales bacterium]|nr:ATP-binding protein [Candidatus Obscuribacterales bacterium]
PPIPGWKKERLFEPFARNSGYAESEHLVSGLGLYICKKIVDAHNGAIECTSVEPAGTTFQISLPAASC